MKLVLTRLGLIVMGALVGASLAEGVVRIVYPHARDAAIPGHLFEIDDELGWRFAPSKTAAHHTRYFNVSYTINALGFRDKSREPKKATAARRIVLYGDSLVFGWGLSDRERFSDRLERQTQGVEILNHGIPGYGLDQEVLLYNAEGEALDADDVMFFASASTLSRIHTGYIYTKYKPQFVRSGNGALTLVPVPRMKNAMVGLIYEAFSSFYLPYFLQTQLAALHQSVTPLRADGQTSESAAAARVVGPLSKELLGMAWEIARTRHHRMTVLVADLPQADRDELEGLCRATGMIYMEAGTELAAGTNADKDSRLIFGPYDTHWNAKANELIASQLQAQLERSAD